MKKSLVYLATAVFALSSGTAFAATTASAKIEAKPALVQTTKPVQKIAHKTEKSAVKLNKKALHAKASVKAPVKVSAKLATPAKIETKPATKTEKK